MTVSNRGAKIAEVPEEKHIRNYLRGKSRRVLKVRRVHHSDAVRIAGLSTQLGYPVSNLEMVKRLKAVSSRRQQEIFVAVFDHDIVGWLEVFLPLSVLNAGKAEIGALVVDDHFRRLGVGSALMQAAHGWAEDNDCPFIYLRSNIVRREAHEFYRQMGYTVFKTQKVFRRVFPQTKPGKRK